MANSRFWLISGNGTRARIFAGAGPAAPLDEIECFVNPEGGMQERELGTDRPGRMADGTGPGRSGIGESHHREHTLDDFARRIADYMSEGHASGEFDRASIVAAPAMLGRLRAALPKRVQDVVLEEVAKDLTTADAATLQAALTRLN